LSFRILFAALALSACFRSTRLEKREAPVDTGVPVSFGDAGGPTLSWDVSDGSAPTRAPLLNHAFARAGHYTVVGKDAERIAWRIEVDVIPRPVVRAVPADAEWVLFAPTVRGDLDATLDFFERVSNTATVQQLADSWVLPALAVDASAGAESNIVDPLEGLGFFTLPGFSGSVALLGVVDEAAALSELNARTHPFEDGSVATRDGRTAWLFADRGYVYAAFPSAGDDVRKVIAHVHAADARGFEARFKKLAAVPAGRLVMLGAPHAGSDVPLDALWASLTLLEREAKLEGRLLSKDPIWRSQGLNGLPTFRHSWEGPVAAVSVKLPDGVLRALIKPGTPEREQSRQRLLAHGIDIDRMFRALTGDVAGLAWFDAEGFLRHLIEAQKPDPRGAAILEAGLNEPTAWEAALGQMLEVFLATRPIEKHTHEGTSWQTELSSQDALFTVEPKSLRLEVGTGLQNRTMVDLSKKLAERFHGAFSPGHASLLVDLGRLREELETPRMLPGLDPMRVVTVQGYAAAFLEQLTPVDHLILDLEPDEKGAKLSGRLLLKQKGQ
jgi:hypothetical protein